MNGQDLLKAMGEIREDYILEAEPGQEKEKIIPWRKYAKPLGVLAAGLVLVAGVGMYQNMQRGMMITEQSRTDEATDGETISSEFDSVSEEEDDLSLQNANMINPWITCSSLTEGEKIAGFTLKVPKAGRDYSEQEIYAVADTLIEVRYVDPDGEEGYRIRKGIGTESVDGDYNLYDTEYTVTIDEKEVTLKGNGSEVAVARWTEYNYSYAITTENSKFSEKEITRLIREIQ